jgi:hypothetical protein
LFFSENDVALVIKYCFNKNTEANLSNKKRKITDAKQVASVVDYSSLKLPADLFRIYLKEHSFNFLEDCLR